MKAHKLTLAFTIILMYSDPASGQQIQPNPTWINEYNIPIEPILDPHPALKGVDHETFREIFNGPDSVSSRHFTLSTHPLHGEVVIRGRSPAVPFKSNWGSISSGLRYLISTRPVFHESESYTSTELRGLLVAGVDLANESRVRFVDIGRHVSPRSAITVSDATYRFPGRRLVYADIIDGHLWAFDALNREILRFSDNDSDEFYETLSPGFPISAADHRVGRFGGITEIEGRYLLEDADDQFCEDELYYFLEIRLQNNGLWNLKGVSEWPPRRAIPYVAGDQVYEGITTVRINYPFGGEAWIGSVDSKGVVRSISRRSTIRNLTGFTDIKLTRPLRAGERIRIFGKLPDHSSLSEWNSVVKPRRPFFWISGTRFIRTNGEHLSIRGGNLRSQAFSFEVSINSNPFEVIPMGEYSVSSTELRIRNSHLRSLSSAPRRRVSIRIKNSKGRIIALNPAITLQPTNP